MRTWIQILAKKSLVDEIRSWGWTESQLRADGVQIYKQKNSFFVSLGDWAKLEVDDIAGAIKRTYPGVEVDWDYEAGPGDGDWEKIF